MLCPQHILSRCGWVGPHVFYEETKYPPLSSHPVSSGLSDPFSYSVRLTTLVFASSWKAIPTQTTWSIVPHAWWKKNALSEWIRGSCFFSAHVIHLNFYTWLFSWRRVVLRDWFYAIQDETTWRSFSVFLFSFFSLRRWCWSRSHFMLRGAWSVALSTDL